MIAPADWRRVATNCENAAASIDEYIAGPGQNADAEQLLKVLASAAMLIRETGLTIKADLGPEPPAAKPKPRFRVVGEDDDETGPPGAA